MAKKAPERKAPKIDNVEKLKDPKYALALHVARVKKEQGGRKRQAPKQMR